MSFRIRPYIFILAVDGRHDRQICSRRNLSAGISALTYQKTHLIQPTSYRKTSVIVDRRQNRVIFRVSAALSRPAQR